MIPKMYFADSFGEVIMKKLTKWLPLAALPLGLICAFLRKALFAAADPDRGLLATDHPAATALTVLTAVMAVIFLWYLIKGQNKEFRFLTSLPIPALGCAAAAGGLLYWCFTAEGSGRLLMALKAVAALCFLLMAFYRFKGQKSPLLMPAAICIAMMALCFSQYRGWGQHTQPQEYLFPALSALLLVLYSLEYCYLDLPGKSCKKAYFFGTAGLFASLACLNTELWPYYLGMSLWLMGNLFVVPYKMALPQDVLFCMDKLEKAGHTVYAVGGCVRDAMLGLPAKDYDLCTSATPDQVSRIFDEFEIVRNGEKHGTIGVIVHHQLYEITTYRTESGYADHRHPDQVIFVTDILEDLARRDFTVNAMAFHPKTGYLDPFGGQKDLFAGILRTVGNPETRFREDGLRILRGVRFACRFRLDIDLATHKAMNRLKDLLDQLAQERIAAEMTQILCHMEKGDLVRFRPIVVQIIPELKECVGFRQHSPYHTYDVFTHTDVVLGIAEVDPAVRWAALLHDAGKPSVFTQDEGGKGHFYGHAQESAQIAETVLRRLKVSNALREQVIFLISHHMDTITPEKAALRKKLSKYGAENLEKLLALQEADQAGKGKSKPFAGNTFEKIRTTLEKLEKEGGSLQMRDLAVNGHDLMEIGYPAGPELGNCQKALFELVLSGEIPNEKAILLQKAKELLEN